MLIMADNRQVIDGGREIDRQSIVSVCFGCSLIEATISPPGQDVTRFHFLCHSTTAILTPLAFDVQKHMARKSSNVSFI